MLKVMSIVATARFPVRFLGCPGNHDPSVAAGIAGAGDRKQAYSAEPAQWVPGGAVVQGEPGLDQGTGDVTGQRCKRVIGAGRCTGQQGHGCAAPGAWGGGGNGAFQDVEPSGRPVLA